MTDQLKVDTRVTVETPEGVDFQFLLAGPGKRAVSFVTDSIVKVAIIGAVAVLMSYLAGLTGSASMLSGGVILLVWFAMSWLYGACFEGFMNGQTPGKKSQNLRVIRTNGTPIGWFEAFGRNLLLVPDGMLALGPFALNTVGLLSMASTKRMQRLGDLVFDTMVIDETRENISRASKIADGVEPIRRSECSGQFVVPERTLAVIERLFEPDRIISDGRREDLARPLATTLKARMGFQEGNPDSINPNQFFVSQTPFRSTHFLKRVLRTFVDSDEPEKSSVNSANRVRDYLHAGNSAGGQPNSRSVTAEPGAGDHPSAARGAAAATESLADAPTGKASSGTTSSSLSERAAPDAAAVPGSSEVPHES